MMNAATLPSGFYGKLPCRGDFLKRRVAESFVEPWDEWLQACMHASRAQLGSAWLDRYLTAPVWRFAFEAGVCGGQAQAGVLVPSVDRVGRYFPLTIVIGLPAHTNVLDVACCATRWFDAAEAAALDALEADDLDAEAFDARVAQLECPAGLGDEHDAARARAVCASAFPLESTQWCVPLASTQSLQRTVNALARRDLSRALQPLALWWSEGSGTLGAHWLATRGLPAAEAFAAMLAGDWRACGWADPGADAAPDTASAMGE